jgi:hypothetical protein
METNKMKVLMAGAGLAVTLLLPVTSNAQQAQQQTDDQASFSQSVKGMPSTMKRRHIVRSELGTRTSSGHRSTTGVAPMH